MEQETKIGDSFLDLNGIWSHVYGPLKLELNSRASYQAAGRRERFLPNMLYTMVFEKSI